MFPSPLSSKIPATSPEPGKVIWPVRRYRCHIRSMVAAVSITCALATIAPAGECERWLSYLDEMEASNRAILTWHSKIQTKSMSETLGSSWLLIADRESVRYSLYRQGDSKFIDFLWHEGRKTWVSHDAKLIMTAGHSERNADLSSLSHPVAMLLPRVSSSPDQVLTLRAFSAEALALHYTCTEVAQNELDGAPAWVVSLVPRHQIRGGPGWENYKLWFTEESNAYPTRTEVYDRALGPENFDIPKVTLDVLAWSQPELDVYQQVVVPMEVHARIFGRQEPYELSRDYIIFIESLRINEEVAADFHLDPLDASYEAHDEDTFYAPAPPDSIASAALGGEVLRRSPIAGVRSFMLVLGAVLILSAFLLRRKSST